VKVGIGRAGGGSETLIVVTDAEFAGGWRFSPGPVAASVVRWADG
jgi:hypothetical protein